MVRQVMPRRDALRWLLAGAGGCVVSGTQWGSESHALRTRAIPKGGEPVPVVGLGTSQAFEVREGAERDKAGEVLRRFVAAGGTLVDTSPMYGAAEQAVGSLAAEGGTRDRLFVATKVWTKGRDAGVRQMEESLRKLGGSKLDLVQVHNLLDIDTHLETLRTMKEDGLVRYVGITHYRADAHGDLEARIRKHELDFVQVNYSIAEREAEARLLPLAIERRVAVLANRPFARSDLFDRVRGKSLPEWAREFDCSSWAQFFLKWVVSHPAITCAIPATRNPAHLEDNMGAARGGLPDAKTRERMVELVEAL
jgi:diketogulonate reductase-like aldo/keto reductase